MGRITNRRREVSCSVCAISIQRWKVVENQSKYLLIPSILMIRMSREFGLSSVVAETNYSIEIAAVPIEKWIPERVRSLKPKPITRTPQSIQVEDCKVMVQVVGCKNVPLRAAKV